jgi:glucarate dehydratase
MLRAVRQAAGPRAKLRIDANEAWGHAQAIKLIERWDEEFDLDFVEAPIQARPVRLMAALKSRLKVSLCANEGLGSEQDALEMINADAADVLCFSSYWVGSVQSFLALSRVAALTGIRVCKHTHGEFGIAAALHQHALLALENRVEGHQQTASVLTDDILGTPIPIVDGPLWDQIDGPGLGIEIDPDKLAFYHQAFLDNGQFLPWGG